MHYRFMTSFAALFVASTTLAHAIEVKSKVDVKGDPAKVWSTIGGWCAISDWHPVIAKCEENQDGGKMHRTLTTKDGGVIKETLVKKSDTSYTYKIDESPLPVSNYTATLAVTKEGKGSSVVWSAKFEPKGKADEAKKTMEGVFKAGLDEIKKKLD